MPKLIKLDTFSDSRGNLTVLEKKIPFDIKRLFYIYGVDNSTRGLHRHKKTIQAVVCISGSCVIENDNGLEKSTYKLDKPNECLFLYPEDFHWMHKFSKDAILLVLASELFDPKDYIYEPY
ncbi:MAG: FdtA/QdtA family cupin domain-containing protein [Polaribacter sp.]